MERDIFAEIEYDLDAPAPASTGVLIFGGASEDPVRRMFYDMRGLASDNPNTWNEARLFYKQAKFMENFTDDYDGYAELSMYSPCYQRLGYERLRTYFTWRAKARQKQFDPICLSYRFLYIYELLACIGVNDASEALDKLMEVWVFWGKDTPVLNEFFPGWLKDFHIYYELPHSFEEFVEKHKLHSFFGEMFLFDFDAENCLEMWNSVSSYNVFESKFYNTENDALLRKAFRTVLHRLDKYCSVGMHRKTFREMFFTSYTVTWIPFKRAQFHQWLRQNDRTIELPGGEKYICQDDKWQGTHITPRAFNKELASFFIKKTESAIRKVVGYKPGLTVGGSSINKTRNLLLDFGLFPYTLNNIIENTVIDFYAEINRVVVNVDTKNLERIRVESQDTTEKLIVPEPDLMFLTKAEETHVESLPEPILESGPDSQWEALKQALNETERQALKLILDGGTINNFAANHSIMPEVLVDGINEKAMDTIGDNILDFADTIEIYDEYKDSIIL